MGGYINWNEPLEQLNLSFLRPLLNAVRDTYNRQWQSTVGEIVGSDPYGSSIREDRLTQAKTDLDNLAARTQSDMIMQYYNANQQRYMEEMERQRRRYEQLIASLRHSQHAHGNRPNPSIPMGTVINPAAIGAGPPDMTTFPNWSGIPPSASGSFSSLGNYGYAGGNSPQGNAPPAFRRIDPQRPRTDYMSSRWSRR